MSASLAHICDPAAGSLADAVRQARVSAKGGSGFELDLSRFLQMQCFANRVHLPTIFRGLEVLEAITDQGKLVTLMRPFLKSSDPQIVSKSVLVLGRRCANVAWMKNLMSEADDRIRANLIESVWGRPEPEINVILESAMYDPHHRVAANAVYGLYLLDSPVFMEGLDHLIASRDALFRRSAIWVIASAATAETLEKLKPLIRDPDANVRRAAFETLTIMRKRSAAAAA